MPRPVVNATGEELYSRLGPWARADTARGETLDRWELLEYCEALTVGLHSIEEVIRDEDDGVGWSRIVDPDRAPDSWLPWLAQIVGVRLPPGLTTAQQRDYIKSAPGMLRGTVSAMEASIAFTLTGTRTVRIVERTPTEYSFLVVTRPSETPDEDATEEAILLQKPAGLVYDYEVSEFPLFDEGTLEVDDVAVAMNTATLSDVT